MTLSIPEISVDLTTEVVEVSQPAFLVEVITADMPAVAVQVPGPAGPNGPAGPAGLVKVTHNANPNVARPAAPLVYWVGSVQPVNADPDDLLLLRS